MKDYTLGGEGIDFFHLTLEQQLALHEWVMANGFGINWVNRLDVSSDHVVVHVFVFQPDGEGGLVRKPNAADDGPQTAQHRVPSDDFPHPDLAESLRGAWSVSHEYEYRLYELQAEHKELQHQHKVRGYALRRAREGE